MFCHGSLYAFEKEYDCMQRLPNSNFLVLDFCEWLKRVILSKAQYNDIDMWDLLFDEKYDQLLLKKQKNTVIEKECRKTSFQIAQ